MFSTSPSTGTSISFAISTAISDEASVFGIIRGDNKILTESAQNYVSYYSACENFAALWSHMYVENLGTPVGSVGNFYTILEWVSDEEADRLQREEGM